MKHVLKIAAVVIALVSVAGSLHAQKFGFVNSAEILSEMPEVKQAEANLDALQQQLSKRLENSYQALQEDFAAVQQRVQRGELSPRQQEEESTRLQQRQQELAEEEQNMMGQIQEKRSELLEPIYDRINQAIADVAKENGYTFIFDKQVLLYSEDEQDLSAAVREKLGF
ncbi:MAG: OmpH family outer membrane protein [Lewinella sp.]|nr:OmpH family outer membrane protein [Lewinella sp.]